MLTPSSSKIKLKCICPRSSRPLVLFITMPWMTVSEASMPRVISLSSVLETPGAQPRSAPGSPPQPSIVSDSSMKLSPNCPSGRSIEATEKRISSWPGLVLASLMAARAVQGPLHTPSSQGPVAQTPSPGFPSKPVPASLTLKTWIGVGRITESGDSPS